MEAVDFGSSLIWDPCCGVGNILDVAKGRGHPTIGSDIVARGARHQFYRGNFLTTTRSPSSPEGRPLAIITNPPFDTPPGEGARIILKAIEHTTAWRVAAIMPLTFLCGQTRYLDLYSRHRPSHVCYYSERPSMPPGTEVEALGDKAFSGGKTDFCAIVWTAGGPYRTESIWLAPTSAPKPKSERRIGRGSQSAGRIGGKE
jgi:hypothetical protein